MILNQIKGIFGTTSIRQAQEEKCQTCSDIKEQLQVAKERHLCRMRVFLSSAKASLFRAFHDETLRPAMYRVGPILKKKNNNISSYESLGWKAINETADWGPSPRD